MSCSAEGLERHAGDEQIGVAWGVGEMGGVDKSEINNQTGKKFCFFLCFFFSFSLNKAIHIIFDIKVSKNTSRFWRLIAQDR